MTCLVFTVQAEANAFAAAMDARDGPYPKLGKDVGGGIHASPAQSRTARFGDVIKNPARGEWRFPMNQRVREEIAKGLPVPASATEKELDPTWGG